MKFIAGLRVWGNWKIGENVLKVFLRLRGSANRRVDLFLPLIASIPGRCRTGHRRGYRLWKPARRHARPTRDRVAQARAEWDGQTRKFCQNEPKNPVATRFFARDSVRWVRFSAGNRTQPRHVAPRETGGIHVSPDPRMRRFHLPELSVPGWPSR